MKRSPENDCGSEEQRPGASGRESHLQLKFVFIYPRGFKNYVFGLREKACVDQQQARKHSHLFCKLLEFRVGAAGKRLDLARMWSESGVEGLNVARARRECGFGPTRPKIMGWERPLLKVWISCASCREVVWEEVRMPGLDLIASQGCC